MLTGRISKKTRDFNMSRVILLADDSPTIQKVLQLALADTPYELHVVSNGNDALRKISDIPADLVLADVSLQGMDGYRICEAVKSDPSLRHIPVVLMFGAFENMEDQRYRLVGADGQLKKPFSTQELFRLFNELLIDHKGLSHRSRREKRAVEFHQEGEENLDENLFLPVEGRRDYLIESDQNTPPLKKEEKYSYLDEEILVPPQKKSPIIPTPKDDEDVYSIPPIVTDTKSGFSSVAQTEEMREMIRSMAKEIIERVAWEVIPQVAERVIKAEVERLLADLEKHP